jgi:hypothetical protein
VLEGGERRKKREQEEGEVGGAEEEKKEKGEERKRLNEKKREEEKEECRRKVEWDSQKQRYEKKFPLYTPLPWEASVFIISVTIKLNAFFRLYTHLLKLERVTILLAQFFNIQVVMISL